MRKLAKYCSYLLALGMSILPWKFNIWLAKVLTFIWVDVFSIRKKVVFDNIDIAFPQTDENIKNIWMHESIYTLMRSLFDVIRVPFLNDRWIDRNVVFHGLENVKPDQAYLVLTLHMGSGDLAAAVISERILPLSLISKRFKNLFLDEFWFSLRTRSKTKFIDAHSKRNAFDILAAIKEKRGVVFVLDQFMGMPYGVESTFFGKTTGTAYGLALFAQKTKLPVLPVYTYWDENDKMHIYFNKTIDVSKFLSENNLDKIADQTTLNRAVTERFNKELENMIKQKPAQWMWVHRRWKEFE
ncbi:MAG: lysophospholipid acyltransferase family protein [Pseudobdellovibrio sp.]